jgi:hypothetical protein
MLIESVLLKPKSMIDDQCQLATNPETSPAILRELSQNGDRKIRQAVAGNPNVPIEILWELVADCPNEIITNPLFLLIPLENPNWIQDIPQEKLVKLLLNHPEVPEIFALESLKYNYSLDEYNIRQCAVWAITRDPDITVEWMEEIVLEHGILYPPIVEHPSIQIESFRRFAQCNDWRFQADLISFCFSDGEDGLVWPQHLNRQEIIDAVIPELIKRIPDEPERAFLLQEEQLPEKFIPELLGNLSNGTLLYIAKSSNTSIIVLKKIAMLQCADKNLKICIHKAATENLQSKLARQHPNAPK